MEPTEKPHPPDSSSDPYKEDDSQEESDLETATARAELARAEAELGGKPLPTDAEVNPISLLEKSLRQNAVAENLEQNAPQPIPAPTNPADDERFSTARKYGGLKADDPVLMRYQRGLVFSLIKQAGVNVMQGKNLLNVSLPVRIMEPRSYLLRITEAFSYIGFLHRAAATTDPLERMKNCIAFVMAGMHPTLLQAKPFNPILGETLQATYADGTQIWMEQVTHHPPVSAWLVRDAAKTFEFVGWGEYEAKFRGNAIKAHQKGPQSVKFADGTTLYWLWPGLRIHGLVYGERISEYIGKVEFHYPAHNLHAELTFETENRGIIHSVTSFFSRSKRTARPVDFFSGDIFRQQWQGQLPVRGSPRERLASVDGTWLAYLDIDGRRYWDIRTSKPYVPRPVENPLPSDSRFRTDMTELAAGRLDSAQSEKVRLEEKQRHEAKLRKQGYASSAPATPPVASDGASATATATATATTAAPSESTEPTDMAPPEAHPIPTSRSTPDLPASE
ncbi:putative Oxysterol-binding protein 9 [Paratrimastix pyriformis]|uniref:Oxysterol-binding protein 9 n=1 Tax=Paratrimastix pyriformis TaxID=342808 RepID=A0ABQ8USB9_9EUKA|nr:putative Oxysterol-binding protein 9 [Paratrimastix pyriformis]|eukprot:GAFH01001402.1.p1 GENE.GAFH01001402.1~~GAFH01001402.1.p1  ORF type:complete len:505 (-),score=38.44 GAFH01001402.1:106-1620(-)